LLAIDDHVPRPALVEIFKLELSFHPVVESDRHSNSFTQDGPGFQNEEPPYAKISDLLLKKINSGLPVATDSSDNPASVSAIPEEGNGKREDALYSCHSSRDIIPWANADMTYLLETVGTEILPMIVKIIIKIWVITEIVERNNLS
jgi:hypothetical protein